MNKLCNFLYPRLALILFHFQNFKWKSNVLGNCHVRIKGVVLKYHADISLIRRKLCYILIIKINLSLGNRNNSAKHIKQSRFSAAGRTEQTNQMPVFKLCGKIAYRCGITKFLCYVIDSNFHLCYRSRNKSCHPELVSGSFYRC